MWSLDLIILHEKMFLLHTFITNLETLKKVFLVNKLCLVNVQCFREKTEQQQDSLMGEDLDLCCLVKGSSDNSWKGIVTLWGLCSELHLHSYEVPPIHFHRGEAQESLSP